MTTRPWHQFDGTLAGVQQCIAHIFRHLQGVMDLDPVIQAWAGKTRDVLREAHTAVEDATAAGWKTKPSWYLVSDYDNAIPPDAERFMAERMGAATESIAGSHTAFRQAWIPYERYT